MSSAGKKHLTKEEARFQFESRILTTFTIVGTIAFGVFGLLYVIEQNFTPGLIELGVGLGIFLNYIAFRTENKMEPYSTIQLTLLLSGLIFLIISGGIQGTGVYWIFAMPIVSLGLKRTKTGKYWALIVLLGLICLAILELAGISLSAYSWIELRQTIASYFVVTILIFLTMRYLETREKALIEQDQKLQKLNQRLQRNLKTIEIEKAKQEVYLGNIGAGVAATDQNGRLIIINPVVQKILNKKAKDVLGAKLVKVIPLYKKGRKVPASGYPCHKILTGKIKDTIKKPFTDGYQLKDSQGNLIPISIVSSPVFYKDKLIGTVNVCQDSTKEAALDREKTEFISIASHQLRTPITNLKWTLETLRDAKKWKKDEKEIIENGLVSTNIMSTLIHDLLNVSRIESGQLKVEKKMIDVVEIVQKQIKQMEALEDEKDCEFSFLTSKQSIKLKTDPKHLAQILDVFLSNAVRYSKPGVCTITVQLKNKSDAIVLSVKDTGIGISKEAQRKLFTKYFRSKQAKEFAAQGSGIGLYYAQIIAKALKGKIWFESTENKGSTFYCELPK